MTIGCPDCGALDIIPRLEPRSTAICHACHSPLERTAGRSIDAALACAVTTFMLLFPANLLPLLRVRIMGASRQSELASGVLDMWRQGWVVPAALVTAFVILLPFLRFGLLTVVLAAVRFDRRPRWLGTAFRWTMGLDAWSMPDVFLLAGAIGYSRVAAFLPTTIASGGWCVIAAAFTCMLSRATLDRRSVWRALGHEREAPAGAAVVSCTSCDLVAPAEAEGSRCERCGLVLRARRPDALMRTTALIITGFCLFWPANFYPMSRTDRLVSSVSYRIIDGVMDLAKAGLWPLAFLIFCTSIVIPAVKLIALAWFIISTRRRSRRHLRLKTSIYRIMHEIGRWSNVDPFTIAVFVPLIQFGVLASARPGKAEPAFILLVVATMVATRCFDPRLMWDAAEAQA